MWRGRKKTFQSDEAWRKRTEASVMAEVTRTWERNVGRYARQHEPFSIMLISIEQILRRHESVDLSDEMLCEYLRQGVRREDDLYLLGEKIFVAMLANVDLAAAKEAALRLGTVISGTPLVTNVGDHLYVTFDYGLAEWEESFESLSNLMDAARSDLLDRRRGRPSRLRPAS